MEKEKRIGFDDDSRSEYGNTGASVDRSLDHYRSRRRTLIVSAGLAVPVALNLPSRWREPIIDTVLLPVHAQTTCTPLLSGSRVNGAADPCPVVVMNAGLDGAQARLLTPSGTVIPVLSLTGLQISGCCNAFGATVVSTFASANLAAPAPPVSLPLQSSVVSPTGNFGMSFTPPVSPLIPISDIDNVTIELDCDGEVQVTLILPGALISSVVGGTAPIPVVCSF